MVAISTAIVACIFGLTAVRGFETVVEHTFQEYGESGDMVLDLSTPTESNRMIQKQADGCAPRTPVVYSPVSPNKLRHLVWSDTVIHGVGDDDDESIEKVTVHTHCHETLIEVALPTTKVHYLGRDGEFEFISEHKYQEALREMTKTVVVDINDINDNKYLTYETNNAYGIMWYNIVPSTCFFSDRVVAGSVPVWNGVGCHQRFAGASVYVNGDEKLVALIYHDVDGMKEALFHAKDEVYKELTLEQFDEHFKLLEQKFAAGKNNVEAEVRKDVEEHQ
ncbi:spherical body protein, putative [Babesia ovata]|uniref:Spherical body protein, putative n=1 Tax=Babesia ovata TaxID=189622 RepID=A0A2H6K9L3_9APIC|nr:spherical body protein, putative [Babesia ovata]GBE59681.1 spherical body protein, putative [Babesia ovata]